MHALQNGDITNHSSAHIEQHLRSNSQQLGQSAAASTPTTASTLATVSRNRIQPTTTASPTTVSRETGSSDSANAELADTPPHLCRPPPPPINLRHRRQLLVASP